MKLDSVRFEMHEAVVYRIDYVVLQYQWVRTTNWQLQALLDDWDGL